MCLRPQSAAFLLTFRLTSIDIVRTVRATQGIYSRYKSHITSEDFYTCFIPIVTLYEDAVREDSIILYCGMVVSSYHTKIISLGIIIPEKYLYFVPSRTDLSLFEEKVWKSIGSQAKLGNGNQQGGSAAAGAERNFRHLEAPQVMETEGHNTQ